MSPVIFRVPVIEPIQDLSSSTGAGITSTSGLPRRVTRNAVFVLLTSSKQDTQFVLNENFDFPHGSPAPVLTFEIFL
jgi:hypothetical protein